MKPTTPTKPPVKTLHTGTAKFDSFPYLCLLIIGAIAILFATRKYQPVTLNNRIDHLQQSVDKLQHTIDSINNRK